MMIYAKRNFQEWGQMVFWQRQDFCERFQKHQKAVKQEQERLQKEIEGKMRSLKSKMPRR